MKRFFAALLALMLALALPLTAMAASVEVAQAKNTVARVVAFDSNGDGFSLGSAFAVGREGEPVEYFVTNHHVIEGAYSIALIVGNANSQLNCTVVESWTTPDLAILRLDVPSTLWKPIVIADAREDLKVGEAVYAIGFPYTGDYTDGNFYNASASDATLSNGIVSSKDQSVDGSTGFRMDCVITNGSSGGPVVNKNGELVGVSMAGLEGNNFAIYSNSVSRVLDLHKISYETPSGLDILVIIVVIIAVLLVAAVVVLLLVFKKKPAANMNQNYNGGDEGKTMPVQVAKPKPAAPAKPTTVRVTCIAGVMKGSFYEAKDRYSFGRDKSCSVVFPDKTPGVSGKHCALYITDGKVTLKDLNSTHGTYLGDGTKLTHGASYPLNRGDVFYLGSKDNGFMIG